MRKATKPNPLSKVAVFRKGRRKISVASDAMIVLRRRMYDWHAGDLAKECGVSSACIYAIRRGTTVWPRPGTFFALLDILDLELILRDKTRAAVGEEEGFTRAASRGSA